MLQMSKCQTIKNSKGISKYKHNQIKPSEYT